jgi:hypothetical protein
MYLVFLCLSAIFATAYAQPLTGPGREQFVRDGVATCTAGAKKELTGNDEFFKAAGISSDRIGLYCHCMMEYTADVIAPSEFSDLLAGQTPKFVKAYATEMSQACRPLLKTITR